MTISDLATERRVLDLFQLALDAPADERTAWIEANSDADSMLRARLMAMLAGDRLANLRTGGATDLVDDEDAVPERIGAYRIVARIGRGGMGAVYRGERMTGDFTHVAAIKLIKPGLLSDQLVERFARERQTLASLEHPYIARLYDGGETSAGAPYIVMELIDGEPLLDWAEASGVSRDGRLRLFEHVCEAIAHAHRNLIVHRDITPSNVLVTRDGTVKLIDFGIARPVSGTADASPSVAALTLTPGYAAPERVAGGEATTAGDIYSLGKLLAALTPPAGDRELAAIVARAVASDPADRYATADALRADIALLRGGFPVAAVGGGRRYVAGKFFGRHRFGVIAAAAALVLLVVALAGTIWALDRARTAQAQAEARFDQTRSIAKVMLFDVYTEVSRTPGNTRARELLARTGLAYLDALAADGGVPIDVRAEVARGYVRLAQVVGGGQGSQLGKLADANDLIARARAMLATIPADRRGEKPVARAFAEVLIERAGNDIYTNNEIARARAGAIAAQRVLLPFARSDEDSARLYATAVQAEGDSHGWDDDYARARPIHQRAENFIAALPPAIRDSAGVTKARSANMRLLGEAMHKTGNDAAAIVALDRAVAFNEALLRAAPDDPGIMRKVAQSLWYRAVLLREMKRDAPAAASIDRAVAMAKAMQARDPNDKGALNLYTLTAEVQAQVLADSGRFSESFVVGDGVIAAHRRLVALAGNAPGALLSMASALDTHGGNLYNGRAYARACGAWREALDIYRDLDRRGVLPAFNRTHNFDPGTTRMAQTCAPPHAGLTGQLRL